MAYDKVVDSTVLDAGLKQVADAIREKGGTSDNLVFPTGMAAAVSAIQAGGGGTTIQSGSFTPAENITTYTIVFNAPVSNVIVSKADAALVPGIRQVLFFCEVENFVPIRIASNANGGTWTAVNTTSSQIVIAGDGLSAKVGTSTTDYIVPAQYNWIAW